jgi:hypothetical protein
VADIDMYSEFAITMTIPAVGVLLIFVLYRGWLWHIQRSATAAESIEDAETGALHTDKAGGLEDADAMAARRTRDLCVWLAIGWLFLVRCIWPCIQQNCCWQLLC